MTIKYCTPELTEKGNRQVNFTQWDPVAKETRMYSTLVKGGKFYPKGTQLDDMDLTEWSLEEVTYNKNGYDRTLYRLRSFGYVPTKPKKVKPPSSQADEAPVRTPEEEEAHKALQEIAEKGLELHSAKEEVVEKRCQVNATLNKIANMLKEVETKQLEVSTALPEITKMVSEVTHRHREEAWASATVDSKRRIIGIAERDYERKYPKIVAKAREEREAEYQREQRRIAAEYVRESQRRDNEIMRGECMDAGTMDNY